MANLGVVSLRGIYHEDSTISWNLATGITTADVGKAVTLDSTAANTMKLCDDNDPIWGRLESVEVRGQEGTGVTIGTVAMRGSFDFTINPDARSSSPDETPVVGEYLAGSKTTAGVKGYVQKSAANAATKWVVVELLDSGARVVAIKV